MKKSNLQVLCLFDYYATTGFATVSENIVSELRKHFGARLTLHIFAINYFGEVVNQDDNTLVLPAPKVGEKPDPFGRYEFLRTLKVRDYDAVFMIQDIGVVMPFVEHMRYIKTAKAEAKTKSFKSIFYFPVDSPPLKKWFDELSFFDEIISYTEYGKAEVVKSRPDLKPKLKVIPHGVNPKHFYPLDEERKSLARRAYFGEHADKFIITSVNRNQPRKDIPNTIQAFKQYKTLFNENSLLYLHMHPNDPLGWDLHSVCEQLNLKEGVDVMFPPTEFDNAQASIEILNEIYNSSDVYLTTTTGEGWGLGITEAMMCKLPVIAPNNTSIIEIGDHGSRLFALEETYPYCSHFDNIVREQCNYIEAAEKLDMVFNSPEQVAEKVTNGYEYAKKINWETICVKWIEIFENLF